MLGKRSLLWVVVGLLICFGVTVQAADWMTMETDHFLITFEAPNEAFAQQTAYYLEEAYQTLTQQLGHEPAAKTRIVLGDFSDMANGFAMTGFGYNEEEWLMTYAGPNSTLRTGIDTWLKTLAIHELTHTIHIDMHSGATSVTRGIFGAMGRPSLLLPDLTNPNGDLPVYLVEGFASYMETINSNGGRMGSALWDMVLRNDVVHNRMMTRDQSSGRYSYSRFTGDAPFYLYGAYFCDYIAREYGQDKLFEIMRENSSGQSFFIDGVFKKVLGESLPTVWNAFIAETEFNFVEQYNDLEAEGLTESERITRTGWNATTPVFSPDGEFIAYAQSGKGSASAIRRVRVENGGNRTLVTANTVFSGEGFSWSPDGDMMVYNKLDLFGNKMVNDLYMYDIGGGREFRLTRGRRASGATWSPDSNTIVFVSKTSALETSLMAMDADGTNIRTLVEGSGEMQFSSPRFSPDGSQLTVAIQNFGSFNDIYVLNADGSNLRPLTQDRFGDFAPQWSPDGQMILFNSDRTGVNNIYAYRLSDNRLFQVTNVAYGAFSPTMSPDGNQIAFMNYDRNGYDVHLMDADPGVWQETSYQRDSLPQPPDFAAFAADFKVGGYTPIPTLLPHFWRPLIFGVFGGVVVSQDLLNRVGYGIAAGVDINGNPVIFGQFLQKFADYPTMSSPVTPPSMTLDVSMDTATLGLSIPLSQTIQSSQTLTLSGTVGTLAASNIGTETVIVRGIGAQGGWNTFSSSGRDGVTTFFSFGVNAGMALTGNGSSLLANANGSLGWVLGGDLSVSASAQVNLFQGTGFGALETSFPLFDIESQMGTWPIYFQKAKFNAFAGANFNFLGQVGQFFGASLSFPTYLWYNFPIEPQIGVVFANGQLTPTFSL